MQNFIKLRAAVHELSRTQAFLPYLAESQKWLIIQDNTPSTYMQHYVRWSKHSYIKLWKWNSSCWNQS